MKKLRLKEARCPAEEYMMMSQWMKDSNPSHFPAPKPSLFKTTFESNLELCHQLAGCVTFF